MKKFIIPIVIIIILAAGLDAFLVLKKSALFTGQQTIFTLIKSVKVTPSRNQFNASFARIGYVPGRDRIVVTFDAILNEPEGECIKGGYAYKEYTADMTETGDTGLINCQGGSMDTGGLFTGDDFYFAMQAPNPKGNGKGGWMLIKYNAVTWESLASTFLDLTSGTNPGDAGAEDPADPMIAVVNGQIDVSSDFRTPEQMMTWSPSASGATHHNFFTTGLEFIGKRILSNTPHINMSSMVQDGDVINFVTGTALLGDMILMRYDSDWKYIDTKILKKKSATSGGMAFDGKRFYVSYLDVPCEKLENCLMNVRLAAFDSDWNLVDDIAVTSFTSKDMKQTARPTLVLRNGRIYVAYDQNENTADSGDPTTVDSQVYVKVYEIAQ